MKADRSGRNARACALRCAGVLATADVVEICRHDFRALDVVADVDLLVLGVSSIISGAHRQQHHTFASQFLWKVSGMGMEHQDRNRTPTA